MNSMDKIEILRWNIRDGKETDIRGELYSQNSQILRGTWESVAQARAALEIYGFIYQYSGPDSEDHEHFEIWVKYYG